MSKNSELLKQWRLHSRTVQEATTTVINEPPADIEARVRRARNDYSYFVDYYFPHYAKSRCGKFHIQAANKVKSTPRLRAVMEWARGHAKSTHFDIMIPLWLKIQEPRMLNSMVLVGKSEDNADKLLGDIQAELQYNKRYINDFGKQYQDGSWEEGEFVTTDGVSFIAFGRGQSPRGTRYRAQRPDYIVLDDIDDDEIVRSDDRMNKLMDWITETLINTMDMGHGRFIAVGNRIAKNAIIARIAKKPNVYHTVVNALDKNGQPSWKEKYTLDEINETIAFIGYRASQKEFFNNPIIEGSVFKDRWIRWEKLPPLHKMDAIIAYCDPSFKSSTKNDYKAIKVWGKIGPVLYLIKAFVRQCSVNEMINWWYNFHESLPENVICEYYMEANFLQEMILDEFDAEAKIRGYLLPIKADKRAKPDKFQRIEALSPFYERGHIIYNEAQKDDKDMQTAVEQLMAIEKGSRTADDSPDADEGAIFMLQKRGRSEAFEPKFGKRPISKFGW